MPVRSLQAYSDHNATVGDLRRARDPAKKDKEPFGRQPQPVLLVATGDLRDVDFYLRRIKSLIESGSYDACERMGNQIKIYPRAVND